MSQVTIISLPASTKQAAQPLANTHPEMYSLICLNVDFMQDRLDILNQQVLVLERIIKRLENR